MADARSEIGKALESRLTAEQIDLLLNEILAVKKQAWGDFKCKSCGKQQRQLTEISDATQVTKSLIELANQAWGRPAQAEGEQEERIVFERVIYMGEVEGSPV